LGNTTSLAQDSGRSSIRENPGEGKEDPWWFGKRASCESKVLSSPRWLKGINVSVKDKGLALRQRAASSGATTGRWAARKVNL